MFCKLKIFGIESLVTKAAKGAALASLLRAIPSLPVFFKRFPTIPWPVGDPTKAKAPPAVSPTAAPPAPVPNAPAINVGVVNVPPLVRLEGDINIDIGVVYDWELKNVQNPSNYNVQQTTTGSQYDDLSTIYDSVTSIYAIAPESILTSYIQGSFFSVQITFVTSGTNPPYTILGHVLELAQQGRD